MSVGQVVGMVVAGLGIVELLATVLLVARRRHADRAALRAIVIALLASIVLSTIGVVIAAPHVP